MSPPTIRDVGSTETVRIQSWPALKNVLMYSLRIEEHEMRESHWHPEIVEMGYVYKGEARMSVMDPLIDGSRI